MKFSGFIFGLLITASVLVNNAQAERIKDLAAIAGVRSNQLTGYGLVVGLDGTGDQTSQAPFTVQSLKSMLAQFGITIPPGVNAQVKNIAAVSLSAELPAFAKPGQTIDVTVSSIANAKSLRGGSLIMSPLKGADGNVYAIAQGNVLIIDERFLPRRCEVGHALDAFLDQAFVHWLLTADRDPVQPRHAE